MGTAIYQLKVTLKNSKPPIWRRIEIPADFTLNELHQVLQWIMEWDDDHLHEFIFKKKRPRPGAAGMLEMLMSEGWGNEMGDTSFGDPSRSMDDAEDEGKVTLEEVAKEPKTKFVYEYDFGDGWIHLLSVEKIKDAEPGVFYPRCTAGRGRGPMEDCGGIWGWYELLEIVNDPEHPEYEERREWMGLEKNETFDEDKFDIEEINERLRKAFHKRVALRGGRKHKAGKKGQSPAAAGGQGQANSPEHVRAISYNVLFDAMEETDYPMPADIKEEVDSWYGRMEEDPQGAVVALERLLERHPHAARLMNYLGAAYDYADMPEKSQQIAEQNYRENPGYLFAKLNYAELFLAERNFTKVKEIMGDKWELSLHYPERKDFHVSEVVSFAATAARYLAGTGNVAAARTYLGIIEQLAPKSQQAKAVAHWILLAVMEQSMKFLGKKR